MLQRYKQVLYQPQAVRQPTYSVLGSMDELKKLTYNEGKEVIKQLVKTHNK